MKVKGDMSFVGPRPALFNQDDVIALRAVKAENAMVPFDKLRAGLAHHQDLTPPFLSFSPLDRSIIMLYILRS